MATKTITYKNKYGIQNYAFSPTFSAVLLTIFFASCYLFRSFLGVFDVEKTGVSEAITYLCYFVSFIAVILYAKDYINTPRQKTFLALVFLWLIALLREMGLQHWLTQHDTTAIKIRFFTNPNNPLHEKIISGFLILSVVSIILWLLIKNFKKMFVGFFKREPFYWTIATFGGLGVATQFCDRFPSKYAKHYGKQLDEPIRFAFRILEEFGEAILPLLFAIALIQFHQIISNKKTNKDD